MKFSISLIALIASGAIALPQGQSKWGDWQTTSVGQPVPTPVGHEASSSPDAGKPQQDKPSPIPTSAGKDQWSNWSTTANVAPVRTPVIDTHKAVEGSPGPADNKPSPTPVGQGSDKPLPTPIVPDNGKPSPTPEDQHDKPSPTTDSKAPDATPTGTGSSDQSSWSQWVKARGNDRPAQAQSQGQGQVQAQSQQQKQASPAPTQAGAPNQSKPTPVPDHKFQAPAASAVAILGSNPSDTCTWEFILTCANQAVGAGQTCLGPLAESSTNCFSQSSCASAIGNNAATCATCFNSVGKQQFINACYAQKSDSNVAPIFQAFVSNGVCDAQGKEIHA